MAGDWRASLLFWGSIAWQSCSRHRVFHWISIFRHSGCVLASCFLAYLAWVRPKKDIVALSTPIYSFLFFIVPTDYSTGIVLQLLYAVSLTILLVRLKVPLRHTRHSSIPRKRTGREPENLY